MLESNAVLCCGWELGSDRGRFRSVDCCWSSDGVVFVFDWLSTEGLDDSRGRYVATSVDGFSEIVGLVDVFGEMELKIKW